MAFTQGNNLGLYYGWNYGEEPWNEEMDKNMVVLGGMACLSVKSATTTAQPSGIDGEVYFIPTGATGAQWAGNDNSIAVYEGQRYNEWLIVPAKQGWTLTVQDDANKLYTFDGAALVDAVDTSSFITSGSSYTATGDIEYTGSITFTGSHGSDPNELATVGDITAAIGAQDFTEFVDKATAQTINGVKTFTSPVSGIDAVAASDLATLSQVDNAVGNVGGANTGIGSQVFTDKAGDTLNFKTLVSGDASVTITEGADEIDFSVVLPASGFVDLDDTPSEYTGAGDHLVRVSASETGLEFVAPFSELFTALSDTPNSFLGFNNYQVVVNSAGTALEFVPQPDSSFTQFTQLTDTPSGYGGATNNFVKVNGDGTALEFLPWDNSIVDIPFLQLNDTPSSYLTGDDYFVKVNATGDGLEFSTVSATTSFVNLIDTPLSYGGANFLVSVNGTNDGMTYVNPDTLKTTSLTDLTDVADFSTSQDYLVKVNSAGDGFDYIPQTSGDTKTFVGLEDTPASYGTAGQAVVVNPAGDGLEYATTVADILVRDEGVDVGTVSTINFAGSEIRAVLNGSVVDVYSPSEILEGTGSYSGLVSNDSSLSNGYILQGDTVTALDLDWLWSPDDVDTQSFVGVGSTALLNTDRTVSISGQTITTDEVWIFTGDNTPLGGGNFDIDLNFANEVYVGKNSNSVLIEAEIIALGLAPRGLSAAGTYATGSSGSPQYFYVCYPDSYVGLVSWFDSDGNEVPHETLALVSVTNTSGFAENYVVQKSVNSFVSDLTITVSE